MKQGKRKISGRVLAAGKLKAALPYIMVALFSSNIGRAWRLADPEGDISKRILSFIELMPSCLQRIVPSLHLVDLMVGTAFAIALRVAVYIKSQNAKKYRKGVEYGSARWSA